jgi:thioredoxin reductase (NADPH)
VAGEEDFIGAGVHFCATCDGPFYKGDHVVVVGGGSSAIEESLGLLRFADHVTLLVRSNQLKGSKVAIDNVMAEPRVAIRFDTVVTKLTGQNKLEQVHVRNTKTDVEEVLTPDGVFVFIGQQPNTGFLRDSGVWLDDSGFVLTGPHLEQQANWPPENGRRGMLETSLTGVFAAGDVRVGSTNQVAAAAGEGATAALLIREHLNNS